MPNTKNTVIPGWCVSTRPGISRFRVRCFASPRNDGSWIASSHPPSPEDGLRPTRVFLAMTIESRLPRPQQILEVEPVREHRQRSVRLARPFRLGTIAVQLDA